VNICTATDQSAWDQFLSEQQYRPFLQSWTMGEVYKQIGQQAIRLEIREGNELIGICQAIIVPARRGKHLAVSYGPVLKEDVIDNPSVLEEISKSLKEIAKEHQCSFIRLSPFISANNPLELAGSRKSPLHLLAEHIWYIPLQNPNPFTGEESDSNEKVTEEEILKGMRKNHRNLIRRATKEGVEIIKSDDPIRDLPKFIELHEETRKRHKFTPYTNDFFRAQVELFSKRDECTLYIAKYNGETIASSVHMHTFGETSYHHGASTAKYHKIPASYLLQWTAIQDAIERGDRVYNFWGIAPKDQKKHPFAGVTTFKTGFGGQMLNIQHCTDIPVNSKYYATIAFEYYRKWRRGF